MRRGLRDWQECHSWWHETGGTPLIEKTEEDAATCPIGRQAGDLDKADVDWLVLWFNWKFEAWTPLRPDFYVKWHNPGGKRQI